MSVVSSELGVGALERRVSVRLGLLDTVEQRPLALGPHARRYNDFSVLFHGLVRYSEECGMCESYPFLWFFFAWLCWDEFFDSARLSVPADHQRTLMRLTGHGAGLV